MSLIKVLKISDYTLANYHHQLQANYINKSMISYDFANNSYFVKTISENLND